LLNTTIQSYIMMFQLEVRHSLYDAMDDTVSRAVLKDKKTL